MKVINKTSFPIIAFCWCKKIGCGEEVIIESGESKYVFGPSIGSVDKGDCFIVVPGKITCHEDPDNEFGYHVSKGKKLILANDDMGVTIQHYLDK